MMPLFTASTRPAAGQLSRRRLCTASAGALLGAVAPARAGVHRGPFPPDVGSKYKADGTPHRFAGNTFISRITAEGPCPEAFAALADIHSQAQGIPLMRKYALLPVSSYHMTVFGGANDVPRLRRTWPADLPLDAPMQACDALMTQRVRDGQIACGPLHMRVDPQQTVENGRALTLRLLPCDPTQERHLRAVRAALSGCTRIPLARPDLYQFHVSLAYPLRWLTPPELADMHGRLTQWAASLANGAPIIRCPSAIFCTFTDMTRYHEVARL